MFTGDVLFVNRVGISHIGPPTKQLYKSLQMLKNLSNNTKVYPGHYYNSKFPSTIKKEKSNNPYLKVKNLEEFELIMDKWRDHTRKYFEVRRKKNDEKKIQSKSP